MTSHRLRFLHVQNRFPHPVVLQVTNDRNHLGENYLNHCTEKVIMIFYSEEVVIHTCVDVWWCVYDEQGTGQVSFACHLYFLISGAAQMT